MRRNSHINKMNNKPDSNKNKISSQWLIDDDIVIRKGSILTDCQQHELDKIKTEIKRENEEYLEQHPEVSILIKMFLIDVLESKPLGDKIISAAVAFFTRPIEDIQKDINRYSILNITDLSQECFDTVAHQLSSFSPLNIMSTEYFPSVDSMSSYSEFSSSSGTSSNLSSLLTDGDSKTSESTVENDGDDEYRRR